MTFECKRKNGSRSEHWSGTITKLIRYGSHYEMRLDSRSGMLVVFGKTSQGGFACIPDFGAGCHLVNLKDKFWNTEKLTSVLGQVDGITAASALYALSDELEL